MLCFCFCFLFCLVFFFFFFFTHPLFGRRVVMEQSLIAMIFLFLHINSRIFYLSLWRMKNKLVHQVLRKLLTNKRKCIHMMEFIILHSNATWLVENNLDCDSFIPGLPNQGCVSSLSSSSIHYWLALNVCKSDTSGSRLKVPFAVRRHWIWIKEYNNKKTRGKIPKNQRNNNNTSI